MSESQVHLNQLSSYYSPPPSETSSQKLHTSSSHRPEILERYHSFVRSILFSHPDARWTDHFLSHNVSFGASPVSILSFNGDGSFTGLHPLSSTSELESIFQPSTATFGGGDIILVEDLDPLIISQLGNIFDIDPAFFSNHLRDAPFEGDTNNVLRCPPRLPSSRVAAETFCIQYFSVEAFPTISTVPNHRNIITATNVRRNITFVPEDSVGLVRRKFSICRVSSKGKDGEAPTRWTAIMLLDPPTDQIRIGESSQWWTLPRQRISHQLYQGGYTDFTPPQISGPRLPKTSQQADLEFYFTYRYEGGPNSSFNIPVLSTPSTFWCSPPDLIAISYIPLKIAASEWIVVIDYLTRVIEVIEAGLKKPKESRGSVSYYESQLRTLHPLRRRCIQYIQDIKASQDGIVLHRNFSDSYLDLISDYTYLTAQMESVKTRIDGMVAISVSAIQIADAQAQADTATRSLCEAKNMRKLTNLALLFVPLSFVASVFSMVGGVDPVEGHFWVYFAVSVPLLVVVFVVAGWQELKGACMWVMRKKKLGDGVGEMDGIDCECKKPDDDEKLEDDRL